MGQYFFAVNLDKRQFIHPHQIGNGLKHGEQTGGKYSTEQAVRHLIGEKSETHPLIGSWAGNQIAFVGDYGDAHPIADQPLPTAAEGSTELIYGECSDEKWENIAPAVREMMGAIYGVTYTGDGWLDVIENDSKVSMPMRPDMVFRV